MKKFFGLGGKKSSSGSSSYDRYGADEGSTRSEFTQDDIERYTHLTTNAAYRNQPVNMQPVRMTAEQRATAAAEREQHERRLQASAAQRYNDQHSHQRWLDQQARAQVAEQQRYREMNAAQKAAHRLGYHQKPDQYGRLPPGPKDPDHYGGPSGSD